ncbi:MAG: 2-octaprenyl-6-methoxyphenyl hydroxylase [Nevskiales bacterium]|nr:2-octaprenyl-6-methoxyphenyl hydroxylase [Nevskiales bacterium]
MRREAQRNFDVVIVGGGLTGASLAVALASLPFKVALVEAAPPPSSAPAWDERTLALNLASRRIFENLGLWDVLRSMAEPIQATHISERGRLGVARFTAEEAGEEALGYNLPVRVIGDALWQRLQATENVTVFCPARVTAVAHTESGVDLEIEAPGETHPPHPVHLAARLVVAADGARSILRTLLNIGAEEHDYGQTAIVGAVRTERPHRGVAYERFTPDGPVALLPRPLPYCALIWTVPTASAGEILSDSDTGFLERLQNVFGHRLGRFLETGRRQGCPLSRVMSDALTAPRVILAGNAAQTLHPVAAQGFNLGLRDVATVAELLTEARDPGAPELLHEYATRRVHDRQRVSGFTDRLVRIFSNTVPGLRGARHLGLLALDLLPPVKAAVLRQNLGYGDATPSLVRHVE